MGSFLDNDGIIQKHDDLLPCPFCGGIPAIHMQGNSHTGKRKIVIRCPTCRIQRIDGAIRGTTPWLVGVAVAQWNKRDTPDTGEGGEK